MISLHGGSDSQPAKKKNGIQSWMRLKKMHEDGLASEREHCLQH